MAHPRFVKLDPKRRDALLRAATSEFAAHGFKGASMNRIIEESGLSKGSTYYYFEGKEDLFFTVLDAAVDKMLAAFGEVEELGAQAGFWEDLETRARQLIRLWQDDPDLSGLLRAMPPPRPGVGDTIDFVYSKLDRLTAALIQVGQQRKAIRTDLPADLLLSLLSALFEAMDRWALSKLSTMSPAEVDSLAALLIRIAHRVAAPE